MLLTGCSFVRAVVNLAIPVFFARLECDRALKLNRAEFYKWHHLFGPDFGDFQPLSRSNFGLSFPWWNFRVTKLVARAKSVSS